MNPQTKKILIWGGVIAVIGYFVWKARKKTSAVNSNATDLPKAQNAYNQMQQLFASVPKGNQPSPSVLNKAAELEGVIEDAGFIVENNKLVKKPIS